MTGKEEASPWGRGGIGDQAPIAEKLAKRESIPKKTVRYPTQGDGRGHDQQFDQHGMNSPQKSLRALGSISQRGMRRNHNQRALLRNRAGRSRFF